MSFIRKAVIYGSVAFFSCIGLLIGLEAAKQRDFQGSITIRVCLKQADGSWAVIDKINAPAANFTTSVVEQAGVKKVQTPFVWNGKSEGGHAVTIKLQGSGNAKFDAASGKLELQMPFQFTVDGKPHSANFNLTTESVTTPLGTLSGQRAVINTASRTATLKMVSATQVAVPGLQLVLPDTVDAANKKERKVVMSGEQLALVIEASGKLTAK